MDAKGVDTKISTGAKVCLMFQDEAGFGRINHPKYCWCEKGIRPSVPCHHIREYRYAYGAMELHGTNREHWKCLRILCFSISLHTHQR